MTPIPMLLDHELKLLRAHQHLKDLDREIKRWLNGHHHSVRHEYDPNAIGEPLPGLSGMYRLDGSVFMGKQTRTPIEGAVPRRGVYTLYATAQQPPTDPLGLLIGDTLHNMRSALDALAYALAAAHTDPLPKEMANSSEFPIFGDEDRSGKTGIGSTLFHQTKRDGSPAPGSGLSKIQGWHPDAQAVVERLQPYKRGNDFRSDPLWVLHELDRVDKHRLLHTTIAAFAGTLMDTRTTKNLRAFGPGFFQSLAGTIETDTPIARIAGIHAIDPNKQVYVDVEPAIDIAFALGSPAAENESVLKTFEAISYYIGSVVLPALVTFLPARAAGHVGPPLTVTTAPDRRWLGGLRPEDEIRPPKSPKQGS